MKKQLTMLCAMMLLAGCSSGGGTTTPTATPEETSTPEPTATAVTIDDEPIASMTAKNTGDIIEASTDEDVVAGVAGDTMRTVFFDYTVNAAALYETYVDIVGDDDNYVIAVTVTIENPTNQDVEMYDTDFLLLCTDEDYQMINEDDIFYPVTFAEEATPVGNMLESIYTVEEDGSITGDLVYIVPNTYKDFSLAYREEFTDETTGSTFYVDFSVE